MNEALVNRGSRASRSHKFLFSLNIGLGLALLLRAYLSRFAPGRNAVLDFAIRMVSSINKFLHLSPRNYNPVGVEILFVALMIASALAVLLALTLVTGTPAEDAILRIVAGVTALAAVPASLLFAYGMLQPIAVIRANAIGLILEIGVVLVCLGLYFARKLFFKAWYAAILVILHYVLWAWIGWQLFSHAIWVLAVTVVPSCAGLAWTLYIKSGSLARSAVAK